MKKNIHPKYNDDAKINCACGNVIKTGSTVKSMEIEICSSCHPFFTGKKKLVDSAGQVDRFKKRMEKSSQIKKDIKAADTKKKKGAKNKIKKKAKKKASSKK